MNQEWESYLNSEGWKRRAAHTRARDNHTCRECYKRGVWLDVHHITYENVDRRNPGYGELDEDLKSVCRDCHNDIHSPSLSAMIRRINNRFDRPGWDKAS